MMILYLSRFQSPLAAVPLVALSGFGLYHLGFPLVWYWVLRLSSYKPSLMIYSFTINLWPISSGLTPTQLADCIEIGMPQLILLIIFSQVNDLYSLWFFDVDTRYDMFFFAVYTQSDTWGETRLWSLCCHFLGDNRVDICSLAHRGWCIQEHGAQYSKELPDRSRWNRRRCSVVRRRIIGSIWLTKFVILLYSRLQDKSSISLPVGSSDFWCWRSICNDGRFLCRSRGGLSFRQ